MCFSLSGARLLQACRIVRQKRHTLQKCLDFSHVRWYTYPRTIKGAAHQRDTSSYNFIFRGIAQLVEQRSPKPRAEGSSPSAPATKIGFGMRFPRPFSFILYQNLYHFEYQFNLIAESRVRIVSAFALLLRFMYILSVVEVFSCPSKTEISCKGTPLSSSMLATECLNP